jgi:hypothetical protein
MGGSVPPGWWYTQATTAAMIRLIGAGIWGHFW